MFPDQPVIEIKKESVYLDGSSVNPFFIRFLQKTGKNISNKQHSNTSCQISTMLVGEAVYGRGIGGRGNDGQGNDDQEKDAVP